MDLHPGRDMSPTVARFAASYADQNDFLHHTLVAVITDGKIRPRPDV